MPRDDKEAKKRAEACSDALYLNADGGHPLNDSLRANYMNYMLLYMKNYDIPIEPRYAKAVLEYMSRTFEDAYDSEETAVLVEAFKADPITFDSNNTSNFEVLDRFHLHAGIYNCLIGIKPLIASIPSDDAIFSKLKSFVSIPHDKDATASLKFLECCSEALIEKFNNRGGRLRGNKSVPARLLLAALDAIDPNITEEVIRVSLQKLQNSPDQNKGTVKSTFTEFTAANRNSPGYNQHSQKLKSKISHAIDNFNLDTKAKQASKIIDTLKNPPPTIGPKSK